MIHISKIRGTALAALVIFGGIQGAHAQVNSDNAQTLPGTASVASDPAAAVQMASNEPQSALTSNVAAVQPAAALTPDEAKQSVAGNVAELQRLLQGSEIVELRTSYNGSYGASLMFYGKEMTYYVALFQQKNFWRVIKTEDEGRAEAIYSNFARRTVQLADVEIHRTKLEAQKAYTDRLIALSQDRANRLQADLDIAHQQQTVVDGQQKQAHDEAVALQQQKDSAQQQLRAAQHVVAELQRETDAGLPRTAH
jgi:chromosome segregation ATPase